jgi:hypothetical protein
MINKFLFVLALLFTASVTYAKAMTFYVDARSGSDTNNGMTIRTAWRTLGRVNRAHLAPGDHVLFKSGDVWHGSLVPDASGSPQHPIIFARYGNGPLPLIAAGGKAKDAVRLYNVQYVEVRNLAITNHGNTVAVRRGVDVVLHNFGTARHIVLEDLYIHDVNGTPQQKDDGGIVFQSLGRKVPSRFDGLYIKRNIIWKVDRSGIVARSSNVARTRWFPSLHVVISDNYLDNIGGDGIVPWTTQGAVVKWNIVKRCSQRFHQYNAGIWEWSADDTFFTMNESFDTKGTRDGEGFDCDYNSRGTHFYRNFSHNNDGGFMLICTPINHSTAENAGNSGSVINENISHDDKGLLVNLSSAWNVTVKNNRFYVGPHDHVDFLTNKWGGWSHNVWFIDNRFFTKGKGSVTFGHGVKRLLNGSYVIAPGWGGATNIHFAGNTYSGTVFNWPKQSPTSKRHSPRPVSINWSSEPMFNPRHPLEYPAYLQAHHAWMGRLFEKVFPGAIDRGPYKMRKP